MTNGLPFPLAAMLERWRSEVDLFRRRGQEALGSLADSYLAEVEAAWQEHLTETLRLEEASQESGYSADHLGRLVRQGHLPNAGTKGKPRIRRVDLPHRVACGASQSYDPDADARTLLRLREDE